ncbi:MAG: hypothetical protein P8X74_16265 [Reinekea sp.]
MDTTAHKSALGACFWMLIGSFLPIIIDSILRVMMLDYKFFDAVYDNVKGGEVFLFTSALITPFFWLLIKSMGGRRERTFKYFGTIFFVSILSFLGGIVFFCYFRIGRVLAESNQGLTTLFSFNFGYWAWIIYIASLLIWYYSTYYEIKSPASYEDTRSEQQEKLKTRFSSLRS